MNEEFNVLADGDIILRAQCSPNNHNFRVHKLVLSLASPVFKDMFGITQPRPDMLNVDIEVIYMTDPPRGLDSDLVLRLIYSFPPPNVDSLVPPRLRAPSPATRCFQKNPSGGRKDGLRERRGYTRLASTNLQTTTRGSATRSALSSPCFPYPSRVGLADADRALGIARGARRSGVLIGEL